MKTRAHLRLLLEYRLFEDGVGGRHLATYIFSLNRARKASPLIPELRAA
jgi:hypothetical protein